MKPGKKTFVFLLHDAPKYGDTPVIKHEVVKEVEMTHQQAVKLFRALEEIFGYLTTGH